MGIIERAVSSKISASRTQSQPCSIGPWMDRVIAEFPLLTRADAFNAALFRAIANVDPSDAESYFTFANEKRVQSSAASLRRRKVLLRADGSGPPRITCGASGHGWLTRDWTIEVQGKPGAAEVVMAVPQHREVEGAVPNHKLLTATRGALGSVLANGELGIESHQGPPALEGAVEMGVAPPALDAAADFYGPLPDAFCDGATIPLPPSSSSAVRDAFVKDRFGRLISETEGQVSLGGGRSGEASLLLLAAHPEGPALRFRLIDEGPTSRQRTLRAGAGALDHLARGLHESAPDAEAAIVAFLDQCRAGRDRKERIGESAYVWNQKTSSGMVRHVPGLAIPVLVSVCSSVDSGVLTMAYLRAETWLLQRERSWTQGIRKQTRDEKRTYTMRGPGWVSNEKRVRNAFRYVETNPIRLGKHAGVGEDGLWFWEVAYRPEKSDDGFSRSSVVVNSIGRSGDVLYYGTELARFFAAFAAVVLEADPEAEFETIAIRV